MLQYALAGEFVYHVSGYLYAKMKDSDTHYDNHYLLIMCVAMIITAFGYCIIQPAASTWAAFFFGLTANQWVHRLMDGCKLILTI